MPENRIRELREERGLTQRELGELIHRSKSVISRLEDGTTNLDITITEKIAKALGVTVADVLGISPDLGGFREDAARYEPGCDDPLAAYKGQNRYLLKVQTSTLDKAGIMPGDVLVVNDSGAACRSIEPLQIALVMYHPAPNAPAVELLRQFVPPNLLITNSSKGNARSLDTAIDDAHIIAVVENVHRRIRAS